jgi:hypothetical protein
VIVPLGQFFTLPLAVLFPFGVPRGAVLAPDSKLLKKKKESRTRRQRRVLLSKKRTTLSYFSQKREQRFRTSLKKENNAFVRTIEPLFYLLGLCFSFNIILPENPILLFHATAL